MTCRELVPIVHGLQKEYGDRIDFVRVNILDETNEDLMTQFGFNTTPEFYLVDSAGTILGFWDETVDIAGLKAGFDQELSALCNTTG